MRTTNDCRVVGAIGSLIVHALVVLILFWQAPTTEDPPLVDVPNPTAVLKDKPSDSVEVTIIGETGPPKADPSDEACTTSDETYMGIGIIFWPATGIVLKAPPQYPAYKAGIREGDVLSDVHAKADKDGYVTHELNRLGHILTFSAKQELICFHR